MKRNLRSEGDSGERGGGERGGRGRQLGLAAGVERSMERRCAAHGARIEESYGYAGDVLDPPPSRSVVHNAHRLRKSTTTRPVGHWRQPPAVSTAGARIRHSRPASRARRRSIRTHLQTGEASSVTRVARRSSQSRRWGLARMWGNSDLRRVSNCELAFRSCHEKTRDGGSGHGFSLLLPHSHGRASCLRNKDSLQLRSHRCHSPLPLQTAAASYCCRHEKGGRYRALSKSDGGA